MKKNDIGFVLLHGAGLGGWIWEKLATRLERPFLAVDYPGRGKRARIAADGLPLRSYVAAALADLDAFAPRRAVIVAHSIGGVVGLEVARLRPERVRGFAAVGAAVPAGRGSYASCLPFPGGLFLRLLLASSGTRPPEPVIRGGLCNDLDEKTASAVVERFTPESIRLYTEKRSDRELPARSIYLRLMKDQALNPAVQSRMSRHLRAGRVVELDAGHLPMLSKPEELARALNDYADSLA